MGAPTTGLSGRRLHLSWIMSRRVLGCEESGSWVSTFGGNFGLILFDWVAVDGV